MTYYTPKSVIGNPPLSYGIRVWVQVSVGAGAFARVCLLQHAGRQDSIHF